MQLGGRALCQQYRGISERILSTLGSCFLREPQSLSRVATLDSSSRRPLRGTVEPVLLALRAQLRETRDFKSFITETKDEKLNSPRTPSVADQRQLDENNEANGSYAE